MLVQAAARDDLHPRQARGVKPGTGCHRQSAKIAGIQPNSSDPEVVAERICLFADALGDRERVIAGCDCGFGTFAGYQFVSEDVMWSKLGALVEGSKIATKRLWG